MGSTVKVSGGCFASHCYPGLAYLWRYIYRLVIHQMAVAGWIDFGAGKIRTSNSDGLDRRRILLGGEHLLFCCRRYHCFGFGGRKDQTISDAFTQARARIGALTFAALLCWTIFWLGSGRRAYLCRVFWAVFNCARVFMPCDVVSPLFC